MCGVQIKIHVKSVRAREDQLVLGPVRFSCTRLTQGLILHLTRFIVRIILVGHKNMCYRKAVVPSWWSASHFGSTTNKLESRWPPDDVFILFRFVINGFGV